LKAVEIEPSFLGYTTNIIIKIVDISQP